MRLFESFCADCKGGEEGGLSGSGAMPCSFSCLVRTWYMLIFSTPLLPFLLPDVCSQTTCLSLLALLLQQLFVSALEIVRKVGENHLFLRFSAIFFFSSVKLNLIVEHVVCQQKNPRHPELPCGSTQDLYSSFLSEKQSIFVMSGCTRTAQSSVTCV